jgi:hypothetical protein
MQNDMMTSKQIQDEIVGLLLGTGREGVRETVDYLLGSTFFRARCHTHHRFDGGLARHSLETCRWALRHAGGIPAESVILSTLLHDICTSWTPRARRIKGHGSRSVAILERLCRLSLTPAERDAILLHMHRSNPRMASNPLAQLVWKADKVSAAGFAPLTLYR